MLFTMSRNCVISSIFGHAVQFEKDAPTHVPPIMHEAVMAAGAVPEEALPVSDKPPELTAEERQALLVEAIEKVVLKNDASEFTAGGTPHSAVLAPMVGFQLAQGERDAAWGAFQKKLAEQSGE